MAQLKQAAQAIKDKTEAEGVYVSAVDPGKSDYLTQSLVNSAGGALAIGVGDKVNMLQYSTYSVISPEGCASILWKSADKAPLAAEAMGITAPRLKELKLIDSVIPEPLGSAHRDVPAMAAAATPSSSSTTSIAASLNCSAWNALRGLPNCLRSST